MLASELIAKLQALMAEHGDLPVVYDYDNECVNSFEVKLHEGIIWIS